LGKAYTYFEMSNFLVDDTLRVAYSQPQQVIPALHWEHMPHCTEETTLYIAPWVKALANWGSMTIDEKLRFRDVAWRELEQTGLLFTESGSLQHRALCLVSVVALGPIRR
jgi:hypothetical protein